MKWMVLAGVALAVMGCSSANEMSDSIGTDPAEAVASEAGAQDIADPAAPAGEERTVEVKNEAITFSYSWPAPAQAIEGLNAELEARADAAKAEYLGYAENAKADAETGDYTFMPHSYDAGWEVAADISDFLSLGGGRSTYTGGAHGNSDYDSLLWDKTAADLIEPVDLFTSPTSFRQAVREFYCSRLMDARAERIGKEMVRGTDIYESCPELSELAIVMVSENGETFDRIDMIAAPYVAGSYAEGSYTVEMPVDSAVRYAVKPEYKDAFAPASSAAQ
ncbi:MAG: DUF4163 domain-containing protein [Pseudomonadota bacterium]